MDNKDRRWCFIAYARTLYREIEKRTATRKKDNGSPMFIDFFVIFIRVSPIIYIL